jgi:hypothetical protein
MEEPKEKITTKDVYLKLVLLEARMTATTSGIRGDILGLRRYFDRWLWVMAILNIVQILLYITSSLER